jgi:hypothetical protein
MHKMSQKDISDLIEALSSGIIDNEESDYAIAVLRKTLAEQEQIVAELKYSQKIAEQNVNDIENAIVILNRDKIQ